MARSDYGIYQSVFRAIQTHPALTLRLLVSGAHLSPEFGETVGLIEEDGFNVAERIVTLLSSDTPGAVVRSMGLGLVGFAQAFERERPDILLVLGDRFDMYVAALAALPFNIPVAHIHGGEVTEGAIDDALRHSMTKLSHLHFATTEEYARRIRQLGEEPWRVMVSGSPALDRLRSMKFLDRSEIEATFGIKLDPPPLLVTFHPVTLGFASVNDQMHELLTALDEVRIPVVFTLPNADTNGRIIIRSIHEYVATRAERAQVVGTFGASAYLSMLRIVPAMVGNSSSGLIEAPSLGLPAVNIGTRQRGRVRSANVVDVGVDRREIVDGIRRAVSAEFRESLRANANPYDAGLHAGQFIAERLANAECGARLLEKSFHDQ